MKKPFITACILSVTLLFVGCGETETKTKTAEETTIQEEVKPCMMSLDNESVVVNWTSFKLTDKIAVGGTFDSVIVSGVFDNETMMGAAGTAQFDIYTASVNSKNPERDVKIASNFFGTMENTTAISGKVVALNEDGTGTIALTMNGVEKEITVQWEATSESRLKISTSISIPDWDAQASLDSLNNVCSLLHTGEDGTSVLWPDVEIEIFADFTKNCE